MSHTIRLTDLIATFRCAAADCHSDAGQTIDSADYDAIKKQEASYHAYADALTDGEMLQIVTPGGHEVGRITPATTSAERSVAAAKALAQAVCEYDFVSHPFVDTFCRLHRTHQQSVMRAMYAVIQGFAQQEHDLRNEATVKFCKRVTEGDNIFPFI